MIRIKSKRAGFRRCGMAHPAEAVEYPDDKFTPEQLAILKVEPMLIVEVVKQKETERAGADLAELTVEQLKTEIARYQPDEQLKGMKKADLIVILEKCQATMVPKE